MAVKVRCKRCGVVVESKHRHDFVGCSCFNGARVTVCCEVEPQDVDKGFGCPLCETSYPPIWGVAVDGGDVYTRIVGWTGGYEIIEEEEA